MILGEIRVRTVDGKQRSFRSEVPPDYCQKITADGEYVFALELGYAKCECLFHHEDWEAMKR